MPVPRSVHSTGSRPSRLRPSHHRPRPFLIYVGLHHQPASQELTLCPKHACINELIALCVLLTNRNTPFNREKSRDE